MILCIDWGATLVKIAKDGKNYAIRQEDFKIGEWLEGVDEVRATGIRSFSLPESVGSIRVKKFDEFDIIAEAANGLAVNVGTGTSMVDTKKREHIGGTGVGGGTIMGLCSLFAEGSFENYEAMAKKGRRERVDLVVGELCTGIGILSENVTVSNLAKLRKEESAEDCIAGVFNMVGEVVGTVACMTLRATELGHITFLGSAVRSDFLKRVLIDVCELYGCNYVFSEDPQFAIVNTLLTKKG